MGKYKFNISIANKTDISKGISYSIECPSYWHACRVTREALARIQARNVLAQNYYVKEIRYVPEESKLA